MPRKSLDSRLSPTAPASTLEVCLSTVASRRWESGHGGSPQESARWKNRAKPRQRSGNLGRGACGPKLGGESFSARHSSRRIKVASTNRETRHPRWLLHSRLVSLHARTNVCGPLTNSLTCRRRHKKCDERRPGCGPCSIASRVCLYADVEPGEETAPTVLGAARTAPSPSGEGLSPPGQAPPPSLVDTSEIQPTRVLSSIPEATPARNALFIPGFQTAEVSHLSNEGHHQAQHAFSPDTVASELLTADLASTRWLDLLATDAAQADSGFSLAPSPSASPAALAAAPSGLSYQITRHADPEVTGGHTDGRTLSGTGIGQSVRGVRDSACELEAWQLDRDISLRDGEAILFRAFTEKAASLLDLFDQQKHFSTHATRLAVSASPRAVLVSACRT